MPKSEKCNVKSRGLQLHAANNSTINTFGASRSTLDLGSRHPLEWIFWIVQVPYSILGADAIIHFDILPDLKRHRLIDNVTKLHVIASIEKTPFPNVSLIDPMHKYAHIIAKLLKVFGLEQKAPLEERGVFLLHRNDWSTACTACTSFAA